MSDNADFILKNVEYDKDVVTGDDCSDKATYTFQAPEFDFTFILHGLVFTEYDDPDENNMVKVRFDYDSVQCIDDTGQNRSIDVLLVNHIIELFCQSLLWKAIETASQGTLNQDGNEWTPSLCVTYPQPRLFF